jgi:Ca2+-binding RTX toxin-like protein
VYLGGSGTQGEAAGDVYTSVENVLGSAYGDTLCGTAGANTLIGGQGNDMLYGGAGNDVMLGGLGADTFLWQSTDAGMPGAPAVDTLVDFDLASGDIVSLGDLLRGETTSTLDSFLFFERVAFGTVMHVSSVGTLNPDDSIDVIREKEDSQVVFQGVDLFSLGDNQAIIHDLFSPILSG